MKHTYLNLRNIATAVLMSTFAVTAPVSSFAAGNGNIEIVSTPAVQSAVSYQGSDANSSAYQVKVNAATPVKFEVIIKDGTGAVLFSQAFESAAFVKTFKILEDEAGTNELTFSVRSLPDGVASNFKVSSELKTVTEVAVVRAK